MKPDSNTEASRLTA